MYIEKTNFQALSNTAATFRSLASTNPKWTCRFVPIVAALAMAGSAHAQGAGMRQQPSPAKQRSESQKLPGELLTPSQRQALAHFGPEAAIEFGDREIPSSIAGRLSPRSRPDDAAGEAQAVLAMNGAAFRRGPDDGFAFSGVETDKAGVQHVRMLQTYKGIPVSGAGLSVQVGRYDVKGISGRFIADLNLDTESVGNSSAAVASALSYAGQEGLQNAHVVRTRAPEIFVDSGNAGHLAIPVEVTHDETDGNDHQDIFIDARNGGVLGVRPLAPLSLPPGCPTGQICTSTQLLLNSGFELGRDGSWKQFSTEGYNIIDQYGSAASPFCYNFSAWCAYFDGNANGRNVTDQVYQMVTIPSTATSATLSFYLKIWTDEGFQYPYDTFSVQIRPAVIDMIGYHPGTAPLQTLATYSNVSAWSSPFSGGNYIRQAFDVTKYRGQKIFVYFEGKEDPTKQTSFVLDSAVLTVQ